MRGKSTCRYKLEARERKDIEDIGLLSLSLMYFI